MYYNETPLNVVIFRPCFPARVSCWFCGERTAVKYELRNSWDCPSCDQYNGFDKVNLFVQLIYFLKYLKNAFFTVIYLRKSVTQCQRHHAVHGISIKLYYFAYKNFSNCFLIGVAYFLYHFKPVFTVHKRYMLKTYSYLLWLCKYYVIAVT